MSNITVEIPVPTVPVVHDQQIEEMLKAGETGTLRQRGMTMTDMKCTGNCLTCKYEEICDF